MMHAWVQSLEPLAHKAAGPALAGAGAVVLAAGAAIAESPSLQRSLIEGGAMAVVAFGMVVTVRQSITAQQRAAERQAEENHRDREAWKREAAETRAQHAAEFAAQREEHRRVIDTLFARFDVTHERHSDDFRRLAEPIGRLIEQNQEAIAINRALVDEIRAERSERRAARHPDGSTE